MNDLQSILDAKGITTAADAVRELMQAGILTGYDVSVYLAQQEFLSASAGVERPMCMLKDIAYKHSIGFSTLRRRVCLVVPKLEPTR